MLTGWVVIQNRYDGDENFNRKWHEYKKGFGKLQADFWLGNELIHRITSAGKTAVLTTQKMIKFHKLLHKIFKDE